MKNMKSFCCAISFLLASATTLNAMTDNEWIDNAIKNSKDGIIVIPKRKMSTEPERDWWLIDRAILVPDETIIILQNCKIKLSDKCRDNFFRSANCGAGIDDVKPFKNIEIRGEGFAVLEGADHPRSTGDGSKIMAVPCPKRQDIPNWDMHAHSYGTDSKKEGESQYGDWRNIGILMANVNGLKIENLRIVESHSWAISLEACSRAHLSKLDFSSSQMRVIDGLESNIENQDGIDLRNGCSDVIISDITGHTGDDVIALTAIVNPNKITKGGVLEKKMHVMHTDYSRRDKDIKNVMISNVAEPRAYKK